LARGCRKTTVGPDNYAKKNAMDHNIQYVDVVSHTEIDR